MVEDRGPSPIRARQSADVIVHGGEAEAIALAAERQLRIVLDDRKARDVALRMSLKVIGTVGILIRAKRAGLFPWLKPLLSEMVDKGFHLSEDLRREALHLAGEALHLAGE